MNKTWTGGWAYLIHRGKRKPIIRSGFERHSTNNRMEVYAIMQALYDVRRIERKHGTQYLVEIISDSGYAVFPFLKYGWVDKWKKGLIQKDVPNYDLWKKLLPATIYFGSRLRFIHIRGHGKNDNKFYNCFNSKVDKIAVDARLRADKKL